ncbi:MAG TPA: DUF6176 family protein [Aliidongia sp.]|nr:DUF6176 family protein [Aliidongia sp.]
MNYSARKTYVTCDRPTIDRWSDYLNGHLDEGRLSLSQEGVRHELWWVGQDDGGLFLIGAMDLDDYEKALAVFRASTLSVDQVHREFMKHWGPRVEIEIDRAAAPRFPDCELLIDLKP